MPDLGVEFGDYIIPVDWGFAGIHGAAPAHCADFPCSLLPLSPLTHRPTFCQQAASLYWSAGEIAVGFSIGAGEGAAGEMVKLDHHDAAPALNLPTQPRRYKTSASIIPESEMLEILLEMPQHRPCCCGFAKRRPEGLIVQAKRNFHLDHEPIDRGRRHPPDHEPCAAVSAPQHYEEQPLAELCRAQRGDRLKRRDDGGRPIRADLPGLRLPAQGRIGWLSLHHSPLENQVGCQ